jgi:hypothetical protein
MCLLLLLRLLLLRPVVAGQQLVAPFNSSTKARRHIGCYLQPQLG